MSEVAYCVCQTVGLATDDNSIPYLASWAEEASLDVLECAAQLTARIAERIETSLLAASATEVEAASSDGSSRSDPAAVN